MAAKVVNSAKFRPGKCAVTGSLDGPFIDTGKRVPRYGVIYLSIPGIARLLRNHGFLHEEEADAILEDNERLQDEVRRLTEIENHHNDLVDAVLPYIEVEPEIITETTVQVRAPEDEEIEQWIKEKGADHPAVVRAQRLEPGSSEEWRKLYGDVPPGHPQFSKAPTATSKATKAQELASQNADNVVEVGKSTNIVVIHDQKVDLNAVLDQNVKDVLSWADGHDDGVQERLVDAEYKRAKATESTPRKGVVEGLGYEYVDPEDYDYDAIDATGPEDVRGEHITSVAEETEQEEATNVQVTEPELEDEEDEDEDEGVLIDTEDYDEDEEE